jgi:hypothetical protein
MFGAIKDRYSPPDLLARSVEKALVEAKAKAPNAKLLVIGPAFVAQPDQLPATLLVRDIVKSQAEVAGAMFVDPLAENWFVDQPGMTGVNGDYPNNAGHALMASKIGPLIQRELQ